MAEVDVVLAESGREIDPAKVARMQRSSKADQKKKGALLQAVLDYREANAPPEPPEAA